MNQLVALGVENKPINALGAFREGAATAAGLDKAKKDAAQQAMGMIGSIALGAMGGDMNGQADPQLYEEGLNILQGYGVDVAPFRGKPQLAPVAARASLTTMQQLTAAQNEREMNLALEKFELDVMEADRSLQSGPKRSLNPVYGTDAQGNPVILQVGDDGTAVQTAIPEGVELSTGADRVDLGTQWGLIDKRSGQMIGTIPKDIEGEEAARVRGKGIGEGQVELGGALQKADQTITLIDQMLDHPGLDTAIGLSGTLDPRNYIAGTDAADFHAMRKQLEGRVFLEAFESLKGGGVITDMEGQKATEAIARLATTQSKEAYTSAMRELKGILEVGKDRSRRRAGEASGVTTPPTGQSPMPATGGEITSQEQYDALPSGSEFMSNGKRYRKP